MKKHAILRIFPVFPALFCTSCMETNTKTNAEEYEEILKEFRDLSDFHSELYIFPESIEGTEIVHFVSAQREVMFTGDYLMYLVLTYTEESYTSEIERISNVKATFKTGEEKHILSYPEQNLYVSIAKDDRYEYVIYNEETYEIAYISNQLFRWDETPVESKYIIPDIDIPEEKRDWGEGYNMYYLYDDSTGMYVKD